MEVTLPNIEAELHSEKPNGTKFLQAMVQLKDAGKELLRFLQEVVRFPMHKPIDLQSTDSGAGVGTQQHMVQFRMAETFMLYNLQYQARFSFAGGDSKSHIAEKPMRHLNEATTDGNDISINEEPIFNDVSEIKLLTMSQEEIKGYLDERKETAAYKYAESLSTRYDKYPCMGGYIQSHVPPKEEWKRLYYDEDYVKAFLNAPASRKKLCPGSAYMQFVTEFYDTHFKQVKGSVQASALNCTYDRKRTCKYHIEHAKHEHWAPEDIHWVKEPEPNVDSDGKFAYKRPVNVLTRTPPGDKFCPSVQFDKILNSYGQPELKFDLSHDGMKQTVIDFYVILFHMNFNRKRCIF